MPCSALILTLNSAEGLERCLKSLGRFGDIVVHDGNSEDGTPDVARRYGARVFPQMDTKEQSVKIEDFTAAHLKMIPDALFDWVMFIDADEFLSEGAAEEAARILETATLKTLVHFPRLPVIGGRVRHFGAFWPEDHLRIHHRKSGCTLKGGLFVHEKYVYDNTFRHVRTTHPLYTTFPSLQELLAKDDYYLTLEARRYKNRTWGKFLYWDIFRKIVTVAYVLLHILWNVLRHGVRDSLPLRYEWRTVRYHLRFMVMMMGWMLRRSSP